MSDLSRKGNIRLIKTVQETVKDVNRGRGNTKFGRRIKEAASRGLSQGVGITFKKRDLKKGFRKLK